MESNLPRETSAWMYPGTLGGQRQLLPSDVLGFGVLCFLSPAACSLYVPCREFSPCKQAAGNVNLAWHFPAHPPHPPHFHRALGDACSLLHCSLLPHSVVLLFQKLTQPALQPSHLWYFSTCGYHQPRCLCSSLGCSLLPLLGQLLIHFRVIPFNYASFYGDLKDRESYLPAIQM